MSSIHLRRSYVLVACAITFVLVYTLFHHRSPSSRFHYSINPSAPIVEQKAHEKYQTAINAKASPSQPTPLPTAIPESLEHLLQQVYKPLIPGIDVASFRALDGQEYKLNRTAIWTEPLGKEFCIIDVDNRPMNNPGEFLGSRPLRWSDFNGYGAGVMNHYLYTLIHGYTYHFIQNAGYPDRKSTWCKMSALLETLRQGDCRFVLLTDADVTITNLELPFEWLMNRWGVTAETAMAVPQDPRNNEPNYDSKGRLNINSGFVLTQRMDVAERIIEETIACPNNTEKYPKCDYYKFEGLCEQGVLSEYVRYEFPNDILEVECNDANGYPGSGRPCSGVFARHHWDRKGLARESFVDSVITNLITILKKNMVDTPGTVSLLPVKDEIWPKVQAGTLAPLTFNSMKTERDHI